MLLKVTAGEEPYQSVSAAFDFSDGALDASTRVIRERLGRDLRVNLNEIMLLFAARAASLLEAGADGERIRREISGMLSYEQAMPGTPEMMRRLDLEAPFRGGFMLSVDMPIPIPRRE